MSLITDSGVLDLQSALTSDSLLSPITDPEVAAHLARHIRKASTDTDPIIVVSLDGGEAWVNLEGRIVSLLLERVEGDPESTYTGDKFTRTFTRDGISLLVQYEVLSSFVIHDMGCTRTEYKLSIDLFSGSTEEHISPESYGEGC